MPHKPVLFEETIRLLNLKPGSLVADGTLGSGGHAAGILNQLGPNGRLIALDQDLESLERCKTLFENEKRISFHHENFVNLDHVLDFLNLSCVDAVILDVGISSNQLDSPERGFSFNHPGPLDMRMNSKGEVTARDLVNELPEKELEKIFREYGEEFRAAKFARSIVEARNQKPIETTDELSAVLGRSIGIRFPKIGKVPGMKTHYGTRVFQALRIAVNRELDVLKDGLPRIWKRLAKGGRLAVISFHSLEDRIVKRQFLEWSKSEVGVLVTKKPIAPTFKERTENRRSRSAKLRVIEKK